MSNKKVMVNIKKKNALKWYIYVERMTVFE